MAVKLSSPTAMAIARMPFLSAREKIRLQCSIGAASLSELGLGDAERIVGRALRGRAWDAAAWSAEAERDAAFLERVGGSSFAYFDHGYPAILRETSRPPFMLYVRGSLPDPMRPSVAVVGTRYPTGRGLDAALALGMEAGAEGVAVVSGLARGIDSAAHRGALAAGGLSYAVLGRGIDEVYPESNRELASRMVATGGGIASEYPPGTPPSRWTFPERNRILAGLCRALVVVEAPGASGALISAAFALEEGRDVYVSRSCMGGVRSAGSDALAADGAVALACFGDILDDWLNAGSRPAARSGPLSLAPRYRPGRLTRRRRSRRRASASRLEPARRRP
ncbi:MAG: DNA-processing protein DprA [Spirochaetes bacterium]|nr:DNA-processing protein DprA [Spirochaetota bacterium]MBU1079036.1 DNA-processing protein DprA [Spirochaetota bacterium]